MNGYICAGCLRHFEGYPYAAPTVTLPASGWVIEYSTPEFFRCPNCAGPVGPLQKWAEQRARIRGEA